MSLERQYRTLIRAFPAGWRARNGEDLVATMLAASRPGQRHVSLGDVVDIVCRGVECRIRGAGPSMQILMASVLLVATTGVVHATITPVSPTFLLTSLVVVLVPGTGAVYSISTAIASGWQRGSAAAFGCTLGIVPHLLAAAAGLSGVMHASAEAFEVVRWLGVAYLTYLAIGLLRSTGELDGRGGPTEREGSRVTGSAWKTIRRGVLINVLNPKLTIFFFAFLPQFLDSPPVLLDVRLIGLSAVFMAMTLAVFLAYAAFASGLRERVLARPRLLRRIEQSLGVVLVGFATRLALTER